MSTTIKRIFCNRFAVLLLAATLAAPFYMSGQAANAAESILQKTVDKIKGSPSLRVHFTVSQGKEKTEGEMVMSGSCFAMSVANGSFETWFDGKTQWTWGSSTNEVNMTQPTAEELMETNPLVILDGATKDYKTSLIKNDAAKAELRLIPIGTKKNDIKEAILNINKMSNFPDALKVTLKDGQNIEFNFLGITVGKQLQPKDFRYDTVYHPDAEIIDLR